MEDEKKIAANPISLADSPVGTSIQEPDEPNRRKNLTLALEIMGLVALIVYTCFAGCQWKVANDTLTEIKNSKADTNRIISASETQASAAQKIADASAKNAAAAAKFALSADGINAQTQLAVDKFNRMAKASEDSLAESKHSLDFTSEQSRLEQRAWVGIFDVQASDFEVTKPILIAVHVTNTGRTPAVKLQGLSVTGHAYPPDELNDQDFRNVDEKVNESTLGQLMPNAVVTLPTATELPMTQQRFDNIASGREVIYIWGKLQYEDVFKRPHYTTFCLYTTPRLNPEGKPVLTFHYWKKHNDTD
jgi:hypothetical protein